MKKEIRKDNLKLVPIRKSKNRKEELAKKFWYYSFATEKSISCYLKMRWDHTRLYECFFPSRNYKWLFIIENVNSTQDTNNDKMWFD